MIESARSPRPHESAVPGWCTSRCPSHRAERRAGKGTPTSGQFSRWGPAQPAAGGRQGRTPSSGVVRLSAGTPALSVIRTAAWYTPFAALRAAVPTRGRRSLASGAIWTVGVPAWGGIFTATGRRSAQFSRWGLPDRRHHLDGGVPVRPALSQQRAGRRCSLSDSRQVGRDPRSTCNRLPCQQVAVPWGALPAASMRNPGQVSSAVRVEDGSGRESRLPAGCDLPGVTCRV